VIILLSDPFTHYDLSQINEAKGLHSFDTTQDDIRQAVLDTGFRMDRRGWKSSRQGTTTVAKKQFDALQERLRGVILDYTKSFLGGKIGKTRWLEWVRHSLREAYQEAFALGMKSSGAENVRASVAQFDKEWVSGAARQELKFFNQLLRQVEEGTYKGRLEKRLAAYAEALQNVFYSGRVMGTPSGHIIDWVGPNDRETCNGCQFLLKHTPYTKATIPTTPRAGDTRCLNNCRCRLVIRDVGQEKFETVQKRHRSKRWYQEKLARLKVGRTL
jgi:hypothetical protein